MRKPLFTAFLLIAFAAVMDAAVLTENFDRTVDVRSGAHIALSNVNGRVVVNAWDQPRIRIHAVKRVNTRGEGDAKRALSEVRIEVTQRDGGVSIVTRYPRGADRGLLDLLFGDHTEASVAYELTVPRNADLDVENVNGAVSINDVSGKLKAETTNGRIELARCAGSVDASTTNGAIQAELRHVTPGQQMELETTNGGINLIVPPTLAANINAETTNGHVSSEVPITTQGMSKTSLDGKLNGGGPAVRLRTTNGSIKIQSTAAR